MLFCADSSIVCSCFFRRVFSGKGGGRWQNKVTNPVYLGAMLENNLIDLKKVKDMNAFIARLDNRGKRLLMMKMIQEKKE